VVSTTHIAMSWSWRRQCGCNDASQASPRPTATQSSKTPTKLRHVGVLRHTGTIALAAACMSSPSGARIEARAGAGSPRKSA
jgi:hypothetical protein